MQLHVPMGEGNAPLVLELPGHVYLAARAAVNTATTLDAEDEIACSVLLIGLKPAAGLLMLLDRGSLAAMAGVAFDELCKTLPPGAVLGGARRVALALPAPRGAVAQAPSAAPTKPPTWKGPLAKDEVPAFLKPEGATPEGG